MLRAADGDTPSLPQTLNRCVICFDRTIQDKHFLFATFCYSHSQYPTAQCPVVHCITCAR
jgi:hypothetical protein